MTSNRIEARRPCGSASWPSGYRCSGPAMQASREAQRWAQVGSSRRWPAQRSMFRRAPASASTGQAATHGAAQPSQGAASGGSCFQRFADDDQGPVPPPGAEAGMHLHPQRSGRRQAGRLAQTLERQPRRLLGEGKRQVEILRRQCPGGGLADDARGVAIQRIVRARRRHCAWKRAKNAPPPSPTTTAPPAPGSRRSSRRSSPARSRPAWPSGRTMCSPTSPSAARRRPDAGAAGINAGERGSRTSGRRTARTWRT